MVADRKPSVFAEIPRTPADHFALLFYAALGRFLHYLKALPNDSGEALLKRYVFLDSYADELSRLLPNNRHGTHSIQWWEAMLQEWEQAGASEFPLGRLGDRVDFERRLTILLAGLIEEDSRFGTVFADLQSPLLYRRPTIEQLGRIIDSQRVGDGWSLCAPLIEEGWLEVLNPEAPRSEWILRVPIALWSSLRGKFEVRPLHGCHYYQCEEASAALIFSDIILQRLRNIPHLIQEGRVETLILRADVGTDSIEVAQTIGRSLQRGILLVRPEDLDSPQSIRLLGPLCTLVGAIPTLHYDLGPGETADPDRLTGYNGPTILLLGKEGGLHSRRVEHSLTITLPLPDYAQRMRHWRRAVNGSPINDLEAIVERFHLSGGYISKVAEMAGAQAILKETDVVHLSDVREATRALNRQLLDTLADPLDASGRWRDLITSDGTSLRLDELTRRCRHREQLIDRLGPAFGNGVNRGVRTLFVGPSGTGKTLAAKILASELGVDIYRVDLASVVNKYIGETEKNLHRVMSRAEALDVILLLDEGDALLGRRSKVQSANDRYANLETNYLLQRLEHYEGIVIVTTNLGDNIDPAFERRMDVVVPFIRPEADERRRILGLHLPQDHQVDESFIDTISIRCVLTGGQIRNAVMHAASLALAEGLPLDTGHLDSGLRSEYRKAGSAFPMNEGIGNRIHHETGTAAFGAALDRARGM